MFLITHRTIFKNNLHLNRVPYNELEYIVCVYIEPMYPIEFFFFVPKIFLNILPKDHNSLFSEHHGNDYTNI